MIRKSFTYKKLKSIVALSVIVGERWAGPTGRGSRPIYSIQIPYHRLPFWYDFEYSLLKRIGLFLFDFHHSFWSICIRIPCRIWADLCKIFPYLYQLRCDPFVFTWWMILAFYDALHICVSRDLFWRILRFQAARITFQMKMVLVRYIYCCLMFSEI